MNRINSIFHTLRASNKRALMPFLCAHYPAPGILPRALHQLQTAGASIAEIGIPFSDPIADGPVIAAAMHEALQLGATPAKVLDEVAAARPSLDLGLVAMVSVSIVHRLGDRFIADAAAAGFDGFIFPDAPLEEAADLIAAGATHNTTVSLLIAPTTPPARAADIARACTGFVYLLARSGITGERADAPDIAPRVADLRRHTDLPIACGFGISTPEHVREVVRHADAAIVGSALVRRMGDAARAGRDPAAEAGSFTRGLAQGLA